MAIFSFRKLRRAHRISEPTRILSDCGTPPAALRRATRECLAVSTVIALEGTALYALLFALIFCQSDSGSFWICEDSRRHDVETNPVCLAHYSIDCTEAHECSGMSEHLSACDVTNGIDMRHRGQHIVIDGDSLRRILHTSGFEVETFDIRFSACSNEHWASRAFETSLLAILIAYKHHLIIIDSLHGRVHIECDALKLLYLLAHPLGDVLVDDWQTLLEIFYDRDLCSEA